MRQVLVTGGGGFIGSHLARELAARGDRVRVLDNRATGSPDRLGDARADIEWRDGDVRDPDALAEACAGMEIVWHLAALASVPQSIAAPALTHAVNATGTLNVLLAARDAGAQRVVFASSCAIYGDDPALPLREDHAPRPLSPYAAQKLAGEAYCRLWPAQFGTEAVALRFFNVFGPGQDPRSDYAAAIPRFIAAARAGRAPTIFGDGEQTRDFIFVRDVVTALIQAASVPGAAGGVFNVGTGVQTSLNTIIRHLAALAGRSIAPVSAPPRPGEVRHSCADVALAQAALGFTAAHSFAAALALTYAAG